MGLLTLWPHEHRAAGWESQVKAATHEPGSAAGTLNSPINSSEKLSNRHDMVLPSYYTCVLLDIERCQMPLPMLAVFLTHPV